MIRPAFSGKDLEKLAANYLLDGVFLFDNPVVRSVSKVLFVVK